MEDGAYPLDWRPTSPKASFTDIIASLYGRGSAFGLATATVAAMRDDTKRFVKNIMVVILRAEEIKRVSKQKTRSQKSLIESGSSAGQMMM